MSKTKKTAYVPMVADILHPGHLNIIKTAESLGEVIVGLFSDENAASYKRLPLMPYEQRKILVENIKGVSQVVEQKEKDYEPNLRKYKPDYLVHGTDWRQGPLKKGRDRAIAVMAEWGGEIVEPEYTQGISSSELIRRKQQGGVLPAERIGILKRLLEVKTPIRVMEAHSGLSAMIVEEALYSKPGQPPCFFDAMWISSLADSTIKGKPDFEYVDLTARIATVNDILEVTTKPIIYDGDTGSHAKHFALTVRRLERLGVSAVIIEDKTGLKINSLCEDTEIMPHEQISIESFCHKIHAGKAAQLSSDFLIIARIESLILGVGIEDALERARAYIAAGADGIMIHSRQHDGKEILEFCKRYNQIPERKYLVAVPTNYPMLNLEHLRDAGVNIVIYANQLLRSSYSAMEKTARSILEHNGSLEADKEYISGHTSADWSAQIY